MKPSIGASTESWSNFGLMAGNAKKSRSLCAAASVNCVPTNDPSRNMPVFLACRS
jgi:hypothetical protein